MPPAFDTLDGETLLHSLHEECVRKGISDLHFSPEKDDVRAEWRLHGILLPLARLRPAVYDALLRRVKFSSKLKLNKRGYIATDETLATSMAGVFAGGDIVTGAATVIQAMGAGRKAARGMKAYLGIRDAGLPYVGGDGGTLFGIDTRERNFARVRVA